VHGYLIAKFIFFSFDVDNDELIATISKAFDGFSDFKKIEDQK
jgi:hypothetical protein